MPPRIFTLTRALHTRYKMKQLFGKVMCYNECGKELHPEDTVVTKGGEARSKSRIYCVDCAETLNLIVLSHKDETIQENNKVSQSD